MGMQVYYPQNVPHFVKRQFYLLYRHMCGNTSGACITAGKIGYTPNSMKKEVSIYGQIYPDTRNYRCD